MVAVKKKKKNKNTHDGVLCALELCTRRRSETTLPPISGGLVKSVQFIRHRDFNQPTTFMYTKGKEKLSYKAAWKVLEYDPTYIKIPEKMFIKMLTVVTYVRAQ